MKFVKGYQYKDIASQFLDVIEDPMGELILGYTKDLVCIGMITRHNEYSCYFHVVLFEDVKEELFQYMIEEAKGIGYQYGFYNNTLVFDSDAEY